MSCESVEPEIIECIRKPAARRVSFQLDKNGEVFVQVFGDEADGDHRREEELIMEDNKVKLSYSLDQCDRSRILEVKEELEKITRKTKEEIKKEWLNFPSSAVLDDNNNNKIANNSNNNNNNNNNTQQRQFTSNEEIQRAGLISDDGNFQPWFFGKITRRESESLLKDGPPGTFLLRLSEKTSSCYTLSIRMTQGIRHFLVITDCRDYKLLGSYQTFSTLTSLIDHHGHAPITKIGNEVLRQPCPKPPDLTMIV